MANPGRLRMLAPALLAAFCLAAAAADAPLPDIKDAYGPMEYAPAAQHHPWRKLAGGLMATGFCVAGLYWFMRRSRRLKRQVQAAPPADAPLPDSSLLALEPGEFYARLGETLRRALADAGEDGARARTPRGMAAAPPPSAREDVAPWQAFWARAEAAEYAAAGVAEDERRADLAFVAGLLRRMRAAGARGGDDDAV